MKIIPHAKAAQCLAHVIRLGATIMLAAAIHVSGAGSSPRPNVVLIMADDLGFSDLGCYGGEIETPNLDRLAREGLRLTQFMNGAICGPSRAALLTGMYAHRVGVAHNRTYSAPAYRRELSGDYVTLAEALKAGGYGTYMAGKWDLVRQENMHPDMDLSNWPNQRGFDHFFGTLHGTGSYWDPVTLVEDNRMFRAGKDFYYTEAIADKAVSYIQAATGPASANPFFLYVAFSAPHYPLHARPERIAKYHGRYNAGWDALRTARHERLETLGIIPRGTPKGERDVMCPPWENEPHQAGEAQRMEVYAAMVDHLDEGVGRIVEALRAAGVLDQTLIIFLSDNGASPEAHPNGRIERTGAIWTDRAIRPKTTDGRPIVAGNFVDRTPGTDDTYASYGSKWAHLSNTPFARFKYWVHNGGIYSPFIVRWPAMVRAKGQLSHAPAHIIDVMATCLDAAQVQRPLRKPSAILPMDGESLLPLLRGDKGSERTFFWEVEGNRAVRSGRWKLVSENPADWKSLRPYPQNGQWELYDLDHDRAETRNLAGQHPEIVRNFADRYDRWAKEVGVMPWQELK